MNNSDKLRIDIQKILLKRKLIDKNMLKKEGWSIDLQRGWSRFCGLTQGFKAYANRIPSYVTIPLSLTKQLQEMAKIKNLKASKSIKNNEENPKNTIEQPLKQDNIIIEVKTEIKEIPKKKKGIIDRILKRGRKKEKRIK